MATKTDKSVVQLVIDGERAKVSLAQMGDAVQKVRKELRTMKEADDPAAYKKKIEDLKRLNQEYLTQKQRLGEVRSAYSKFMTEFKQIAVGVLGGNALTFAVEQLLAIIPSAISRVGSLSDELADVAKATDMSTEEVKELNSAFKGLNTRTASKELRAIAEMGGKFGVAKDDILAYVEAVDKLNVAFGDNFDSVEDLSDTVLKLRNIFSDIKSDKIGDDVLHIGNAMNVLEAQGAATGKGMADFASRMGGVIIPLGATSGQVLGLSATLEELSVTAERGSTAVNTIFQKMLTDVDTFAKVAGMSSKDFAALIEKDIFGAFMKFAEGTKRGGDGAVAFANILKDAELSGSGASEVLLKLSSNTGMLTDKIATATTTLGENNSVLGEFEKKNNNAAAVIEKLGKKFDALFAGLTSGLEPIIMKFGEWFGVLDQAAIQLGELNTQQKKVVDMESKMPALLSRYEELKNKAQLSKEEHAELRGILQKITEIVPQAGTEFDKYGNALDINRDKVTKFIAEQRSLLEAMRQTRRETLRQNVGNLNKEAAKIQDEINKGVKSKFISTAAGGVEVFDKLSEQDYAKKRARLAQIQKEIHQNKLDYRALDPNYIPPSAPPPKTGTTPTTTPGGTGTGTGTTGTSGKTTKAPKKKKEVDPAKQQEKERKELEEQIQAQREADEAILRKKLNDELNKNALAVANGQMSAENERALRLDAEQKFWSEMFLVRQNYGKDTDEAEQQLAEKTIERAKRAFDFEKELAEQRKELAEQQKQAEYALADAKREALGAGVEALRGFFEESSITAKGLFALEKAIAIAQVIVNTQREIASYYSAAATMQTQLAPVMGPAAVAFTTALATKQSLAAKIRAGISIGTIGAQAIQSFLPGREQGGYSDLAGLQRSTTPAGYVRTPTFFDLGPRSYMAGEKKKMEYIIPYEMLQDPMVSATARQLEAWRITGQKPSIGSSTGSPGSGQLEGLLMMQLEETRALRMALESGSVKTSLNYSKFEDYQTFIEFIRNETSM